MAQDRKALKATHVEAIQALESAQKAHAQAAAALSAAGESYDAKNDAVKRCLDAFDLDTKSRPDLDNAQRDLANEGVLHGRAQRLEAVARSKVEKAEAAKDAAQLELSCAELERLQDFSKVAGQFVEAMHALRVAYESFNQRTREHAVLSKQIQNLQAKAGRPTTEIYAPSLAVLSVRYIRDRFVRDCIRLRDESGGDLGAMRWVQDKTGF